MKLLSSLLVSTALVLAACGTNSVQSVAPMTMAKLSTQTAPQLPAGAMARVSVDASGADDAAKAELRLDPSSAALEESNASSTDSNGLISCDEPRPTVYCCTALTPSCQSCRARAHRMLSARDAKCKSAQPNRPKL